MTLEQPKASGPDLSEGVDAGALQDGQMLAGHVGKDSVLLARCGAEFFAIGAVCTHYNAPLAGGLLVGDTASSRDLVVASAITRHSL
jgi:apoptosis-inducing factor 3